jgi:hypothetical protein
VKVRSEIEQAGVKEKLDQINAFIAIGDARIKLTERLALLKNDQARAYATLGELRQNVETYAGLVQAFAPLQVANDQIGITPLASP